MLSKAMLLQYYHVYLVNRRVYGTFISSLLPYLLINNWSLTYCRELFAIISSTYAIFAQLRCHLKLILQVILSHTQSRNCIVCASFWIINHLVLHPFYCIPCAEFCKFHFGCIHFTVRDVSEYYTMYRILLTFNDVR
jgi:hypothetical protein